MLNNQDVANVWSLVAYYYDTLKYIILCFFAIGYVTNRYICIDFIHAVAMPHSLFKKHDYDSFFIQFVDQEVWL